MPTRRLARLLFAVSLLMLGGGASADEAPAPSGDARAVPGRLAPQRLDLDGDPATPFADRPRPRADIAPWGWQLAAFLAALAAAVAVLRGLGGGRQPSFANAAVSVLGALPLGGQHTLRVVRFGRRTLLIGLSPSGCQVLAETDEPLVAPLAGPAAGDVPPPAATALAPAPTVASVRGAA